ncbi:HOT1 [Candida jiufengensis]|uniref:HOT1 n=1 Tax=Candida jiufengensis TaxID=497108 RepID=UPI002225328A|nr:HOT1 [Candida jiufengensis]KAI5955767.1 HOT1 [Candida jiufengensis]
MNDTFNNSQSGQTLYYNNHSNSTSSSSSGGQNNNQLNHLNGNNNNNNNTNNSNNNNVLNNVANNSNHGDQTNGHISNQHIRGSSSRQSNSGNNQTNDPSNNQQQGQQHTINDLYQLISQLQQQNTINNQIIMKMNFMSDSIEEIKRNLLNLHQQFMFTLQNNSSNNSSSSNVNNMFSNSNLNNQFKTFEIFTKHLNKLNKEIEEINSSGQNLNPNSLQPQQQAQQSGQQPSQQTQQSQQQRPQVSQPQQQSQNPPSQQAQQQQGQSSHLQNQHQISTNSVEDDSRNHQQLQNNQSHTQNGTSFDDEVDLTRKNLGLRSPAPGSTATSPYVFELGFSSRGSNLNGHITSPINQPQIPNNNQQQQQKRSKNFKSSQQNNNNAQHQHQQNHQHQQQQHHLQNQHQTQRLPIISQQNNQNSNYSNSYMLPMPPLLSEDKSNNLAPHDQSLQFLLSRESSGMMTSALRQQPSHTRPMPPQPSASTFSFDDNDIEQSIDDLEQQTQTGTSATTQPTTNSSSSNQNNLSDQALSNGINKNFKKRKLSPDLKSSISTNDVPQYKLERSLKALSDIWKEYAYGVNDKPPLKSLESKYGTKWRNETESRTFLRRKKIYEAIEIGTKKGYSEEDVINELENYRSYDKNGSLKKRPLSWLSSNMPDKFNNPATDA